VAKKLRHFKMNTKEIQEERAELTKLKQIYSERVENLTQRINQLDKESEELLKNIGGQNGTKQNAN
jgi:hypothetical protein